MPSHKELIIDDGDLRKYRTELPNIIDDMELTPYEYRLYGHYKRVAGASTDGKCFEGYRTIAERCQMSQGMITKARNGLIERGLITVEPGAGPNKSDIVRIVDIWVQNFQQYAKPVHTVNTTVHEVNTRVHTVNTTVHEVNERKNHKKKEPSKNEPREEGMSADADARPPTEWQEFVGNLCWVCYGHKKVNSLTDAKRGQLMAEAKKIHDLGYGTDQLRAWYRDVWQNDWRYRKNKQRPVPADVRSSIAAVEDPAPAGFDEVACPRQSAGAEAVDRVFARLMAEGVIMDA